MTAPHPLRCDTCDHFGEKILKINAGKKCPSCDCVLEQELIVKTCKGEPMHPGMQSAIDRVGCASHSSATDAQQRIEEVIGELERLQEEAHNSETFSRNGESTDYDYGVFAGREGLAKEAIALLRESKRDKK